MMVGVNMFNILCPFGLGSNLAPVPERKLTSNLIRCGVLFRLLSVLESACCLME